MDYYEVIYADNKFDIIFELKFNADEMHVYVQGSEASGEARSVLRARELWIVIA